MLVYESDGHVSVFKPDGGMVGDEASEKGGHKPKVLRGCKCYMQAKSVRGRYLELFIAIRYVTEFVASQNWLSFRASCTEV